MATTVTWNNVSYSIPAAGELNWASLSDFLIAVGGGGGSPGAQVAGKAQKFGMRVVTTSPATANAVSDCVLVMNLAVAGASTIDLPAGVAGQVFVVVDGSGDAATNNITIDPNGAETIMGASTYVMNVNKSAVLIGYDGSDWKILGAYEGASIPDSRLATISTAGKVANSATTATDANTANTIVARDASGDFSAGTISAALSGNATTATTAENISGSNFTNDISNVGNAMTVDTVGGKTSAEIATSVDDTIAATNANTASVIVKRDASGNFAAGTITADLSGNASTATSITGNLTGDITSVGMATSIASDVIVNDDVKSDAAIAGTKISPDFGSQNVTTTGNIGGTNALITGYEELTAIATPSTPAAGKVRVYAKSDSKLYRLDDAGNESSIGSGGGSAGINYLTDWFDATKAVGTVSTVAATGNVTVTGSFPTVTSAWYADATSGAAAIASSSDNTLRGTTNYLTALSGASTSGATFVQTPVFNIDGEDLGKALSIKFDLSGVTTDDDWDVVMVRYNSSGVFQELISVAGNVSTVSSTPSAKLPLATASFRGFFITGATASDLYAMRWRRRNGSDDIRLDTLVIGPDAVMEGAINTDWEDHTPVFPGVTIGNGSVSGRIRRVGSSLEYEASFVLGTTSAVTGTIFCELPSGLNLTYSSGRAFAIFGVVQAYDASNSAARQTGTVLQGTTTQQLSFASSGSGCGNFANTVPFTWAANDILQFKASVPIAEWSANTVMASRAVEEYASNFGGTSTSDLTSFAYGPQGSQILVITAGLVKRVRFQTAILPTDTLTVEVSTDRKVWLPMGTPQEVNLTPISNYLNENGVRYGLGRMAQVNSTDVNVYFGPYSFNSGSSFGSPGTAWTDAGLGYWRVRKVSSGAAVGFPVSARNVIGDTSGTAVPAGYVGEIKRTTFSGVTPSNSSYVNAASLQLTAGTWILNVKIALGTANGAAIAGGFSTDSNPSTFSDLSVGQNFGYGFARTFGADDCYLTVSRNLNVSSTTTYYVKARVNGTVSGSHVGEIEAIRIA